MAKDGKDISHEESKGSTSSEDNEEYDDLRVVAVIDNETTVKKLDEKFNAKEVSKKCEKEMIVSVKTEVIHLDEAPIDQTFKGTASKIVKFHGNPRVIELSDDKLKMELRREFKVDVASHELSVGNSSNSRISTVADDDGSADILSRLPPGTILIKQRAGNSATGPETTRISSREDSDYVHDSSKDSTGTNSSESSSAASYATAGKVRRMQYRSVRSKKIVEVRRNPVRNKKKKPIDEDFTRPRQRLMALKRKSSFAVDNPTRKRARTVSTPYMNTRSVTRKMYTVGATYQAPTANDALEWKEWPTHGMHERPIWHPQVGLAYEYNDRSFISLDGQNYREIIEDPVIEVVSVDPHPERMSVSYGRRNFERPRYYNVPRSLNDFVDKKEPFVEGNSFASCMHGSFHSVLAYCARVVNPTYKKNVDMKIRSFSRIDDFSNVKTATKLNVLPTSTKNSHDPNKIGIPSLIIPATSSATAAQMKIPETNFPSTSTSGEVPKCLVIPRKTIHFTNVRNIQGNILQEVFNRSSKNTLIFLKPTDPPGKTAEKIAAALKNSTAKLNATRSKDGADAKTELNLIKLDDNAISDEALMEMSSMYNNLLPIEENENTAKNCRPANYATRPVTAIVATKIPNKSCEPPMANSNYKTIPIARPSYPGFRPDNSGLTINQQMAHPTRFSYSNQASEIAKILAEYNQKATKNSIMRNSCYTSPSVVNVRGTVTKNLKPIRHCVNNGESRNTYFSVVEQPKVIRLRREEDLMASPNFRGFNVNGPIYGHNARQVSATITSETAKDSANDDNQAMDLTTARSRDNEDKREIAEKSDESRKWLEELIEDTAVLYCAAAGVHQDDVAEYINTLDSAQSIQWLGS